MTEDSVFLFQQLLSLQLHWGVQRIPPGSPLGPEGFVVNIGFEHFYAPTLEAALRRAVDHLEATDAIRQQ